MPWELGYFDGLKSLTAILPIAEKENTQEFNGREYLGLYPYVDLTAFSGGKALFIHESLQKWVRFADWLKGNKPAYH